MSLDAAAGVDEAGLEDTAAGVDEAGLEDTAAGVDDAGLDETAGVDTTAAEELTPFPPQFPNAVWQPVPQYASVEPHHPLTLQQLPNADPTQVLISVSMLY